MNALDSHHSHSRLITGPCDSSELYKGLSLYHDKADDTCFEFSRTLVLRGADDLKLLAHKTPLFNTWQFIRESLAGVIPDLEDRIRWFGVNVTEMQNSATPSMFRDVRDLFHFGETPIGSTRFFYSTGIATTETVHGSTLGLVPHYESVGNLKTQAQTDMDVRDRIERGDAELMSNPCNQWLASNFWTIHRRSPIIKDGIRVRLMFECVGDFVNPSTD